MNDEDIYACNICDEGFDVEEEVKKHLKETHKKDIDMNEQISCSDGI